MNDPSSRFRKAPTTDNGWFLMAAAFALWTEFPEPSKLVFDEPEPLCGKSRYIAHTQGGGGDAATEIEKWKRSVLLPAARQLDTHDAIEFYELELPGGVRLLVFRPVGWPPKPQGGRGRSQMKSSAPVKREMPIVLRSKLRDMAGFGALPGQVPFKYENAEFAVCVGALRAPGSRPM